MKRLSSILAATTLVVATIAVLDFSRPASGQQPSPARAKKVIELDQLCYIRLMDQVALASGLTGVLEFVEPTEGDVVNAGQTVAGLHNEVATAAFESAKRKAENTVEIRYSAAAAAVSAKEYEKALSANGWDIEQYEAFAKGEVPNPQNARTFAEFAGIRKLTAVPEVDVERARLAAEKSVLEIEQAKYQQMIYGLDRDEAEAQLKEYAIEAPFDGIVTRVYKSKGEAVRQGDPVLEVVNTSRVRVEGYVNIKDVWAVKPGTPVKVQLELPDAELEQEKEVFDGKIVFVDVTVQPVTGGTRVWAEVANRDNILRSGLTARMTIHPEPTSVAVSIPEQ